MATMAQPRVQVTVGVDTHGEVHVAAVLDGLGRLLGTTSVEATEAGYERLYRYAREFGDVDRVGVEGTGAYGAGLTRHLRRRGLIVIEVDRPDRKTRRAKGKSDPIDAEAAARAVLSGRAQGTPKSRDGVVEMIRALRVCRRSAVGNRTQAMNQIRALVLTGPEKLRASLRDLGSGQLVDRLCRTRTRKIGSPLEATKLALGVLARRHRSLSGEIDRLDHELDRLVAQAGPSLLRVNGVGTQVAGQLLVTAGDNPERLRSEAAFAHLCGVAPLPASSGKTTRHRLNRGGDRAANNALWTIVMVRLAHDGRTKDYMSRRLSQGHTKAEVVRCLKRYAAREVFRVLVDEP